MNMRIIRQLYKKEMLDVLRDKKTVIMMLIVPLLVYPLMFVAGMAMMSKVTTQMNTQTYTIGVNFIDSNPELLEMFLHPDDENLNFKIETVDVCKEDVTSVLRSEAYDAIVMEKEKNGKPYFQIFYLSSVTNSGYAEDKIKQVLAQYADNLTEETIRQAGLDEALVLNPIIVDAKDYASTEESTGSLLGMIVPFMLVVSLLMGTMYPAIDTTAGERERGTLETILTLPVTNQELIFSKFLTVATIGIASALLNIISMGGIGVYVYKLAADTVGFQQEIRVVKFLPAIIICLLCILAFAVFISALSMCVCVFARSYKEANNYITPLMLVVMFASFVGFMPNVSLTRNMALVPVANLCLLIRDLLAFKFHLSVIVIVLISNIGYGILSVLLLGKLYDSEAVLFGDGSTGVQIFERRSNMKKGGVPSLGDAWLALPVVLMLMIYVGGYAGAKSLLAGTLVTQGLIVGIPLLIAWYTKKNIRQTFRFSICKPGYLIGGVILMAGTLLIGMVLSAALSALFPGSAQSMTSSMDEIYQYGYGISLLIVAVIPAICEEMLFRGFLFSAFENRMGAKKAIVLVAVLFGVYHMNLVQSPTAALLGLALCYLSAQAGSLLPCVLMHFFNNALSVTATFYPQAVGKVLPFLTGETINVLQLLAIGFFLCAGGIHIMNSTRKHARV